MTDELLQLVIRKNTLYKEWKATTDEQEYLIKKGKFRTFDNIVEKRKLEIKQEYYYDTFQAQKTDLKKSWGTLNEALNRNKQNIDLPSEFIYKNKAITDRVEIANSFNEYFVVVVVVVVGFSSSCWMMEQTCSLSIHLILIQYISSNECSSVVYGACLLPFETCQVP